ncbi:MAG: MFS transporter [Solirubrobacteraceae bacterium]
MLKLLRDTPSLRRFFAAFFQSQIGTGAAYVALLLVAYHRFHSGWAISLVLLGEFLPGIVLAPLFGSLADRISRRRLVVCADLLRALCFVALAIVPSFAATVALALLAGVGTALFRPAINAALPGMVPPERRSQLTAIFYASVNSGLMLGPALAAGLLLITTAPVVLVLNAVSFVVSAGLLAGVDLGPSAASRSADGDETDRPASVWADTRAGARAAAAMPGVPVLMGVGALVVLTGAMFNVLAPLFATGPLHAGGSGYSVLMALYGLGMVAGSWTNARMGSDIEDLRRRWLVGIALSGLAMAVAALAPNFPLALMAFTLIGLGENLLVGPEMRLMQEMVTERLLGRVFGLKDVLENIAFVTAFLGAGALLSFAGVRAVFVGAGLVTIALAAVGAVAFRTRRVAAVPALETGGE